MPEFTPKVLMPKLFPIREAYFADFDSARLTARTLAYSLGIAATIRPHDCGYLVIPRENTSVDLLKFFNYSFNRTPRRLLAQFLDRNSFSSEKFAWTDRETGLAWDVQRVFHEPRETVFPDRKYDVLNAVCYAGFDNWRLPTLCELETLVCELSGQDDGIMMKTEIKTAVGSHNIWSDVPSADDGVFFNFRTKRREDQYFTEQRKDRSTSGDGYRCSATTILVRSGSNC